MIPLVISGFPGVGKSTFTFSKSTFLKCIDLDSSDYHWIEDNKLGKKYKNPDFPKNYVNKIKELYNSCEFDIIFISSHSEVRKMLNEERIYYVILGYTYLSDDLEEAVRRFKERKNSDDFIEKFKSNIESYFNEAAEEPSKFNYCLSFNYIYNFDKGRIINMCTIEKLSKIYYENGLDVITHYLFTNPYIYHAARARINEFCIQSIDDLLDYEFGFKYGFNKTH